MRYSANTVKERFLRLKILLIFNYVFQLDAD